jgi:hypothetical protein
MGPRIARQKAGSFEASAQLGVELDESARDAQTGRIGLPLKPAAIGQNKNVEFVRCLSGEKGLPDDCTRRFGGEVLVVRLSVYSYVAISGTEENTGDRLFPPAGSQMLNGSCH